MQTRCPHCQTTFRVSQAQLDAAQGKVRCGKCQQVFNAREHINPPAETASDNSVSKKAAPTPPPQIDWLHQTPKSTLDHVAPDKDTYGSSADIEVTDITTASGEIEFAAESIDHPADESRLAPAPTAEQSFTIEETDDIVDYSADEVAEPDGDLEVAANIEYETITSKDSLIPGDLNMSYQDIEKDVTLPGIAPAYEDDSHLNALDERGLDDLHSEIERQLQTSAEAFDIADDDTYLDADDNAQEYLEEVEETDQADKAAAVEKIELSALPDDSSTSAAVNWNADVHHDPEIPAALRSSMQALEKNKKRHPLLTTLMAGALLLLIAGLGLQLIIFRSYDIATQWPQTRPILTTACSYLPCVYSGRRDPRRIELVNRDIRVHPSAKHALLISATLLNQAGYAQPFPRVDIKLSDLSGEVVAERIFAPRDYLKKGESRLKLLRPNIPTVITLDVLDPGSEAVNFEFRFL
jgi:predicted Zn finger-like uncharacterized protein